MRNILFVTLLFVLSSCSMKAQTDDFQKFYKKYAEKDGITVVTIAESVQVLAVEDSLLNQQLDFYEELIPLIESGRYSEFMKVNEKDQRVIMMSDTTSGEFYIIVGGEDNAVIRMGEGLNFEQLGELFENIDMDININN